MKVLSKTTLGHSKHTDNETIIFYFLKRPRFNTVLKILLLLVFFLLSLYLLLLLVTFPWYEISLEKIEAFAIFVILLIFMIMNLKDLVSFFIMFFRTLIHPRRHRIIEIISSLCKLPASSVDRLIKWETYVRHSEVILRQLLRDYTISFPSETPIGILSESKVMAKFYVDLLRASVEKPQIRQSLASSLCQKILQVCEENDYSFDRIAVPAEGNVVLALEVADYLHKPLILAGDVAGRRETIVGNVRTNDRIVIVDDISSSGGMLNRSCKLLKEKGAICRYIFVVIDRNFGAKRRVKEIELWDRPLDLISIYDLDDADIREMLRS